MNLEQLGLVGVFLAGAIPWFEAIAVVPAGIIFGLDPVLTVLFAAAGNILTIAVFAYGGGAIRNWIISRRVAKGKEAESPRFAEIPLIARFIFANLYVVGVSSCP